jgi:hypothetical protein
MPGVKIAFYLIAGGVSLCAACYAMVKDQYDIVKQWIGLASQCTYSLHKALN